MRSTYLSQRLVPLLVALLAAASLGLPPAATAEAPRILEPGDYAAYIIGDCEIPAVYLYPPFYGFEDAESSGDQVRIYVRACPAFLRWDVVSGSDGVAEIRLEMANWYYWYGVRDGEYMSTMFVQSKNWGAWPDDPIFHEINATLHTPHTVHVDLATMDTTAADGTYLGRWIFLTTTEEVIAGRVEILRNWYHGTAVTANATVTKDLTGPTEVGVEALYGMDTFVAAWTDLNEPFPEGLERYIYSTAGGWKTLRRSSPVYDPTSSLLIFNTGAVHYNDVLFHLYGMLQIDDDIQPPDTIPSAMTLVDTNLFTLPDADGDGVPNPWEVIGYDPSVWEATPDGDGGGNGATPGDGDGSGDGSEGDGEEGADGEQDGGEAAPPAIPWVTVGLLAAAAVVALLTLLRGVRTPPR